MGGHFVSASIGHNSDCSVGHIPKESSVRLFHSEDDGEIVRRLDVIDVTICCGFGAVHFALHERIEGPISRRAR